MKLLLDTNILFHLAKDPSLQLLTKIMDSYDQKIFISIASVGEIRSIAMQNNWGNRRRQTIDKIFEKVIIMEINENITNLYSEIDAFSQRRNPSYTDYSFSTPRNMGKNDLWIAATAALLGLKLVTTDADFNHLNGVFMEVQHLKPESFRSFSNEP